MPKTFRVIGLPRGDVDPQKQELQFTLRVSDGKEMAFTAKIGVAEQVISGLARMARTLRQPNPQAVSAETVAEYLVQQDAFGAAILLRFVTPDGVPYTFALPKAAAIDIAAQLQSESAKDRRPGRA